MDQLHAVQGNKRKFYLRCSLLNTSAYLAIVVNNEHSFQHASIWPIIYTKMAWTTNVKKKNDFFSQGIGKRMHAKHQSIKKYCITVLDKT